MLLDPDYGTLFHRTYHITDSGSRYFKDIFVWIVVPRHSVNYFNYVIQK